MKKIAIFILLIISIFLVSCKNDNLSPDEKDPFNPGDVIPGDEDEDIEEPIDPTNPEEPTEEEKILLEAYKILETLTLEEKVGQMFMVGFNGTGLSTSLTNAITRYKFGNIIYMGENVTSANSVLKLSSDIQNLIVNTVNVPAFISMDQEGGLVVRMIDKANHYIGGMALTATKDSNNAYLVGKLMGEELKHFGINMNLAPSLDVNNNSDNPVIGIRSYSDDPKVVSEYGVKFINGLRDGGVSAAAKHFPGHGDTDVDSHYGLPRISHSLTRLNEVEFKPFKAAIENNIDAIMTAHIVFSEIDPDYPATLSSKVITDLLRKDFGFNGIIMTDSMNMNAVNKFFGAELSALMAVKAGVDILLYTESTTASISGYNSVLNAVKSGEISESRIDESVLRILVKKIKMNLFADYLPKNNLTDEDFKNNANFNKELIRKSITVNKGNIDFFDTKKSTLFISTVNGRYPLDSDLKSGNVNNTLGTIGVKYFKNLGNNQVDKETIENSLNNDRINTLKQKAANFEQVIVAVENITASQVSLVNELLKVNPNLILVSLKNPYDINQVGNVKNHICTFGYYKEACLALFDLLNKEYKASGVMPVRLK